MKGYSNEDTINLLTEAVDIAANGETWHHKHMLWSQSFGLQGHKRLNRYESSEDRRQMVRIQNYIIDMFGVTVEPSWDYVIAEPTGIKSYLEAYLKWENSVYVRLAEINQRLISDGFPKEAKLIRKGLPAKELKRVRRMLTDYALAGWDMPYILEQDKKLHDKIRKREK